MSTLPLEPFEVKDFSGGLTDFYLLGDKTRYQRAANYLLSVDKTLELRYGSNGYGRGVDTTHLLPGNPIRVSKFLFHEDVMLVQRARTLMYLPNAIQGWTPILGPEGAQAISGGNAFSTVTSDKWNGHLFYTSSGGGNPGKLYKDQEGAYQVRTLGLPVPASTPNYTKTSLLSACIALANDLRSSMIAHVQDTNIHAFTDLYSRGFFEAVTPAVTDTRVFPTPAPAATSEATLYPLVRNLGLAYENHGYDPGLGERGFHLDITIDMGNIVTDPPKGPYKSLTDNGLPASLERAAEQLDELRTRWHWHRLGLFTHSSKNVFAAMDLYPVTVPPVGTVDLLGLPRITGDFSEVIRYANYLKHAYNSHVSNGIVGADFAAPQAQVNFHSQVMNLDQPGLCTLPDAATLEDAQLLIYWIWALYGRVHTADANIAAHTNVTFDSVGGSADITDVGGGAVSFSSAEWIIATTDIFNDPNPLNRRAAKVVVAGVGTATLNKTLINTVNNQAAQHSQSYYHGGYTNGTFTTVTTSQLDPEELLDPSPAALLGSSNLNLPATNEAWIELAASVYHALALHYNNLDAHQTALAIQTYLTGGGPFYKPQLADYGYAVTYRHNYTAESGIEFQVDSPPIFVGPIESAKVYAAGTTLPSGFTEAVLDENLIADRRVAAVASPSFSNLPVLRNAENTNYAVAEVELDLFRTQDGGSTYYRLDSVANGTLSYTDTVSDTVGSSIFPPLSDREPLYTTGGEKEREQAPIARYLHVLDNTAFYAYITDTGQVFKGRVIQSIPGIPESGPADFFYDLPDEILGVTSYSNNVIVLCRESIHRLGGGYNNLGQGTLTAEPVGENVGCISDKSIVKTELGIFFAGTDGFYCTDGFKLIKISIDLDDTYKQRIQTEAQAACITGTYDELNKRIWWSTKSRPGADDVDETFVYHQNYGVKPSGVFTGPICNGNHWAPTALAFVGEEYIRGDKRGLLFRHNKLWVTDPKIPTDSSEFEAIDQWGTVHIPYDYTSCALDFGTIVKGTYTTKIHVFGANNGNTAMQVWAIADNNKQAASNKPLAPMLYKKNPRWGDARIMWGDADYLWKYDGQFNQVRRFPHANLRAQLKQVRFLPWFGAVYSYDEFPEESYVDYDSVTKKVTIQTPVDYEYITFPPDVVDMYIAFEQDEYVQEFLITQWASEELTIADADNDLDTLLSQKWVIRGYRKEAGLSMLAYNIKFSMLGERGDVARSGVGEGENG